APEDVELPEPDPELVASRARLLPEERDAGSDDPLAEAEIVLAESELRTVEVADQADGELDDVGLDDVGLGDMGLDDMGLDDMGLDDVEVVVLEVERRTSAETVAPPGT